MVMSVVSDLKIVSAPFLLVYFVCLKESSCEIKKDVFYFTSKALFKFRSWDNQSLIFQVFKCHDVIKCLSMKHETNFTE